MPDDGVIGKDVDSAVLSLGVQDEVDNLTLDGKICGVIRNSYATPASQLGALALDLFGVSEPIQDDVAALFRKCGSNSDALPARGTGNHCALSLRHPAASAHLNFIVPIEIVSTPKRQHSAAPICDGWLFLYPGGFHDGTPLLHIREEPRFNRRGCRPGFHFDALPLDARPELLVSEHFVQCTVELRNHRRRRSLRSC